MSYDYFYSLTYHEYTVIVEGHRRKELDWFKHLRWAVWQIVRHNPFLKNPPRKPENLIELPGEGLTEEAADRMKQALLNKMKQNG